MKKFAAICTASVLTLGVVGCGTTDVQEEVENAVETVEETVEEVKDTVEEVNETVDEVKEELEDALEVMSYEEYVAADVDTEVVVECYVMDTQSWWDNQITVYAADEDGAYFMYNMACAEEDAELLTEGTKIKVTGYKSEWAGEVEIVDATFEILEGSYVAEATDVTEFVGTDDLANYMNQKVAFTDLTVVSVEYKNGEPGDDIYVTLAKDDVNIDFCLEYYLNGSDEDFYTLVGSLEEGTTVDVEAYLYWYEGANPHLTAVTVK